MRELFDELIDLVIEMWERSSNPEVEIEDILLPLKASMILMEGESYLNEDDVKRKRLKKSTKGLTLTKGKTKFRFGRKNHGTNV